MNVVAEKLAKKYARSFLNVYGEALPDDDQSLQQAEAFLKDYSYIHILYNLPTITSEQKRDLLSKIISYFNLHEAYKSLVVLLTRQKRWSLLPLIFKSIRTLRDEEKKRYFFTI